MKRILIVDDDPDIGESLPGGLSATGAEIATAKDGEEALARVALEPPDIVLTDVRMPGLDGVELLRLLRERAPTVDVILMTAYDDMPRWWPECGRGPGTFWSSPWASTTSAGW